MKEALKFYSSQSRFTDPGQYASQFNGLPTAIAELCSVVHGLVAHHDDTQENYGFTVSQDRLAEANTRYVERILDSILKMDPSPLTQDREPQKRFLGSCRDFAIMLCSMLRHQNVTVRLRCGFAGYFGPSHYSDHWVCEYWNKDRNEWLLVDAEIGDVERKRYNFTLDNTNLSRDQFIVGGAAWKKARQGKTDPDMFGVHSIGIKGFWFIRANILRDLASLNKVELLPWDYTEFFDKQFESPNELPKEELGLIDQIAKITSSPLFALEDVQNLYNKHPEIQAKGTIKSYLTSDPLEVTL